MARMTTALVRPRLQARDKLLVRRVQDSFVRCGLSRTEHTGAGGQMVHTPRVVSADTGPPGWVQIDLLPGQSAEDFAAHAPANRTRPRCAPGLGSPARALPYPTGTASTTRELIAV
jgi:hypothetical protein